MTAITASARGASSSSAMKGAARFGLASRAFVYVVIGWLAVQIARGHGSHEANSRGALAEIAQQPFGVVLLWVMAIGFAAYAIWRVSEARFGTATDGEKLGPRLVSLVRGVIYAGFCVATVSFIAGTSKQGQSQQQTTATARVMSHTGGRWLVAVIGVVVVVVGLGMVLQGITRKFEKNLRLAELSRTTRTIVVRLGVIGTIARGLVFAIAGALVVEAAVTFKPGKSTGLDGALRDLADRPYGPWLLGTLALGLIAFGLYGFAAARWTRT
jgi:hypothetical protein